MPVPIAYLKQEVKRPIPLSRLNVEPDDIGIAGAEIALKDNNTTGRFTKQHFTLDVERVPVEGNAVQALETVETFREMLAGMLDIYISTINNRLNTVMKVLTIFATIFAPLTFIAGVYGMNFQHMPELRWRWGYPLVMAAMLVIALGMLREFKRRRWF